MTCESKWTEYRLKKEVDEEFAAYKRVFGSRKAYSQLFKLYKQENAIAKQERLEVVKVLSSQPFLLCPQVCGCKICNEHAFFATNYTELMRLFLELKTQHEQLRQKLHNDALQKFNAAQKTCIICKIHPVKSATSNICGPECDKIKKNQTLQRCREKRKRNGLAVI